MSGRELDEFGISKIYRSSTDPKRAKSWLIGRGDWEWRKDSFFEDYSSFVENGQLIFNFKKFGTPMLDDLGRPVKDSNGNPIMIGDKGKGRSYVLASIGGNLIHLTTETNHIKLRKRGYMAFPNDWKNVEITIIARVKNVDWAQPIPRLSLAARGYHHHSPYNPIHSQCEGSAYYAVLKVDGSIVLTKELFHKAYCAENPHDGKEIPGAPHTHVGGIVDPLLDQDQTIEPRWIGMKGIFYTNERGNPKLELWLDKNPDTPGIEPNKWDRILQIEDSFDHTISEHMDPTKEPFDQNGWFLVRKEQIVLGESVNIPRNICGGDANERITWGGPAIILRWDALTEIDIKKTSVREIVPPVMSLRNLLELREISSPVDMRSVAADNGLTSPFSLRDLAERLL